MTQHSFSIPLTADQAKALETNTASLSHVRNIGNGGVTVHDPQSGQENFQAQLALNVKITGPKPKGLSDSQAEDLVREDVQKLLGS